MNDDITYLQQPAKEADRRRDCGHAAGHCRIGEEARGSATPRRIAAEAREADEINALTGRERRVKIKGMRFDTLAGKIRKQERLLNGIGNPLADGHRKQVDGLIATYEEWRKQAALSFGMAKSEWESIKSIGSSIEGITEALRGNGNVWQLATGLIDGFVNLYCGIQTVAGIIQMLAEASSAHAEMVGVEAAAETSSSAARAASATTSAAASTAIATANKLERVGGIRHRYRKADALFWAGAVCFSLWNNLQEDDEVAAERGKPRA